MGQQVYSVEFSSVTITAAGTSQDWFEITPADDRPLAVIGLFISQSSEVGDAAEEGLDYKVIRGHATSGSGGSSSTPALLDPRAAAAGFACEVNNTTIASTGTPIDLHSAAMNIRVGIEMWLPPEAWWRVDQAQTSLVVRMLTTVADDIEMSGTLYVMEG